MLRLMFHVKHPRGQTPSPSHICKGGILSFLGTVQTGTGENLPVSARPVRVVPNGAFPPLIHGTGLVYLGMWMVSVISLSVSSRPHRAFTPADCMTARLFFTVLRNSLTSRMRYTGSAFRGGAPF